MARGISKVYCAFGPTLAARVNQCATRLRHVGDVSAILSLKLTIRLPCAGSCETSLVPFDVLKSNPMSFTKADHFELEHHSK